MRPRELARTGAEIDRLTQTGVAAVAAGGALVHWSARRAARLEVEGPDVDDLS